MIDVSRRLPVPAPAVWDALIDLTAWPEWGPSLRQATVDHGGTRLRAGSTGRVQTAVGLWLPFEVTEWRDGERWAWRVAGVAATAHRVGAGGSGCRAVIEIPSWAPVYAPLCWVALGRLGRVAATREPTS